jgi:hypothetical protein
MDTRTVLVHFYCRSQTIEPGVDRTGTRRVGTPSDTVVRRPLPPTTDREPPTTDREHRSDVTPPDTAKVTENHYARPYEAQQYINTCDRQYRVVYQTRFEEAYSSSFDGTLVARNVVEAVVQNC